MKQFLALLILPTLLHSADLAIEKKSGVFQSFEGDGYDNWLVQGPAFGLGPSVQSPPGLDTPVKNYANESFLCSAHGGLASTGTLTSPEFIAPNTHINFLFGGSRQGVAFEILHNGKIIHSQTGDGDSVLRPRTCNIAPYLGKKIQIRFRDNSPNGFLIADHLTFLHYPSSEFPSATRNGSAYEPGLTSAGILPSLIIPEGLSARIFANHENSQLHSPTALSVAENGDLYIAETHRFRHGIFDNRMHLYWVLDDLAANTVEDRRKLHEKWQHKVPTKPFQEYSEKIRLLSDTNNDGKADQSKIFADGFNNLLDGTAAGVLAYNGKVYFACIPNLYLLEDTNNDGSTDTTDPFAQGFGVHISLSGHDMNGFAIGPDGRIYGTIGDRGLNITTREGLTYTLPDQGCSFRFEPDGSHFEILHLGLRNPKEIAFNEFGDAFTVDNNADLGDKCRIIRLIEGADSGWRINHQMMHTFHRQIGLAKQPNSIWMADHMWDLQNEHQPAWLLPPIAHLTNGPSGLTYHPGTALGGQYQGHFLICDYKGGPAASGIWSFRLEQHDANYILADASKFIWGLGATDIDFGYNGTAYITDFVNGWESTNQGRIISLFDQNEIPETRAIAQLFQDGFTHRSPKELLELLEHPDYRVRQRAQFALEKTPKALAHFYTKLISNNPVIGEFNPDNPLLPPLDSSSQFTLAGLHSIWGIANLARREQNQFATAALLALLSHNNAEYRAQAAKHLGESTLVKPDRLIAALKDESPRVQFFAALSLARLAKPQAFQPLLALAIHANDLNDPYLRHAATYALSRSATPNEIASLSGHALPEARLAALVALRHLRHPGVNRFLFDHNPAIRHEAIRIINDDSIEAARPALPP
ncbi:MAG: HEAT repeat domain-containing protein, partial [Verrucomicrobiota bacterium]